MTDKTGGLVFPRSGTCTPEMMCWDSEGFGGRGMTLRDYFAAKAMASVSLALDINEQQLIANAAYAQADAMLREREK